MFYANPAECDYARFSSDVRLELRADGRAFDLAAIGPNDVTPRMPMDLPPCDGEIIMVVDGQPVSWMVRIKHGAVPFDRTVQVDSLRSSIAGDEI